MLSHSLLNLEAVSDSPLAAERHSGLPKLRFAPELEREFLKSHLARVRLRVRIWQVLGLAIATFFSISKVIQLGWLHPISLVHVGLLMPLASVLVWGAWSCRFERIYLPIARISVPLTAAVAAMFAARGASLGHSEELAILSLQMLCVFLLSGLLFRSALVAGLAMLAAHLAASVFFSVPATIRIESGIFLGAIAAVGSGVYWNMDHASRKSFLERELIAELALRDALTGLRNRRAFDEYFVRLWAQAVGDRRRLAIVMFDVDHFKRFNDLNGHQLGDDVLQRVARCARGLSDRPMDFASRYGGDEFVLLLYDLAQEHVRDLAERLRHVVADLRIECPGAAGGPAVTVTITIGVVVIAPTPGRNPGCALRFADEALYRAKQAGRNCVRMIREEEYNMLDACTLDGSELGRTG